MELVGQGVDDGHRGARRHLLETLLPERPPDDGVDVPGQDAPGVLEGLLAAELGAATVDDDGVSAELGHTHLEGEPGPGGVLLEDDADAARTLQRPPGERVLLEFRCESEDLGLLGRTQIVVPQEVSERHCAASFGAAAPSRTAGSAATSAAA